MATEAEKIVIECSASIGICRKLFKLTYSPEDFEDMTREQIEAMVSIDAFEYASQNYLDLGYELPEGLGEESGDGDS